MNYTPKAIMFLFVCLSCATETKIDKTISTKAIQEIVEEKPEIFIPVNQTPFSRDASFSRLKNKIENGESVVIHIRIPLCDNENQGIVPVPKSLGNGFDLNGNLYWGAKHGFKNHFKKYTDWKFIKSEKDINNKILERVFFKKTTSEGGNVYIISDAYKGDKMKTCLIDYFSSLSGSKKDFIEIDDTKIGINSNADLIIFSGHNGMMDYELALIPSIDDKIRETSAIGCISHKYFKDHLLASMGYPVLMTTNYMAPEAYVLEAIIDSWIELKDENEIKKNTGKAYHRYQNCGIKGATRLFRFGWK